MFILTDINNASDDKEDRLMIDPSLLVAKHTYDKINEEMQDNNLGEVLIPHAFLEGLSKRDEYIYEYYLSNAQPIPLSDLRNILLKIPNVVPYSTPSEYNEDFNIIRSNLLAKFGKSLIIESLWEEWLFMQSESWIVSRSRKTFRRFIHSGAIALETGRDVFDGLVAKTLKLPKNNIPNSLTNRQRLRATAKWIAVGGSSVTSLFEPMTGMVGSLAANYFLLMDP